jgi:hypothetical protein
MLAILLLISIHLADGFAQPQQAPGFERRKRPLRIASLHAPKE